MAGQRKIRELWKNQLEQQRKADRLRNKKENTVFRVEGIEVDSTAQYNETEQYEQQMIIKSNIILPITMWSYCVSCKFNIMYDIVILVMPDGSLYTAEHEMSLQMEGLTKPRRKRGRPPKVYAEVDSVVCNINSYNISCKYFLIFLNSRHIKYWTKLVKANYSLSLSLSLIKFPEL